MNFRALEKINLGSGKVLEKSWKSPGKVLEKSWKFVCEKGHEP